MNLPTYLQNSTAKKLNETALADIGASLPPHISIRGNAFTLVDATGAQQAAGPVLDACIADLSDVMCKQYYAEKWTPDSNEPPACWSANGIGPSRNAMEPQSQTCEECQWNKRGSAVSALSGAAIRACRDEKWLAILIPSIPQVQFQLKLTPGSFKNWQAYVKTAEGSQTEINNVVTRLGFQPGVTGVLTFQAVSYITEDTANLRNMAYEKKSFDVLVGRNDRPITAVLTGPATPTMLPPQGRQFAGSSPAQTMAVQQPVPFGAQPAATPAATFTAATAASPSNGAAPTPRRRRTKAEIEAANVPQAPQGQSAAPIAPFRPQAQQEVMPAAQPAFMAQPAGAPQTPAASFGIQPGVAPNPELQSALDGLFKK